MDWNLLLIALVMLMFGILAGAALGYYTAATDSEGEAAVARSEGFEAGFEAARRMLAAEGRGVRYVGTAILADEDQEHA